MIKRTVSLITLVLFSLYASCSMLLVSVGVSVYNNIRSKSDYSDVLRTSIGYIENKLRSNDIIDSVYIENRNGLKTLVLKYAGEDDLETLLYYWNGSLIEMFKFTDTEISPEFGTEICVLSSCDFSITDNRFLFECTDVYGKPHSIIYTFVSPQGGTQ